MLCSSLVAKAQSEPTLLERLTNVEKKTDKLKVGIMFRGAREIDTDATEDVFAFRAQDFRIKVDANITKNIYFTYQQALNRSTDGSGSFDDLPSSLNIAGLGVRVGKWDIFAGRQFVDYGGYEYDKYAMDVYQYSPFGYFTSAFHTGLRIGYDFSATQTLRFQVVDSYNYGFEEQFAGTSSTLERAVAPLTYSLYWKGNFFSGAYKTIWSLNYTTVAKDKANMSMSLGNMFTFSPKCNMYVDINYSREDVDTRYYMTVFSQVANDNTLRAENSAYLGVTSRLNVQVTDKLNLAAKFSYDSAYATEDNAALPEGHYTTIYTMQAIAEYAPFVETPMYLFANVISQSANKTENMLDLNFNSSTRINLGVKYFIPIY